MLIEIGWNEVAEQEFEAYIRDKMTYSGKMNALANSIDLVI